MESGLARNEFAIVEAVLSRATVDHLLASLERIDDTASVRKRSGVFAVRNLLEVREVREPANSEAVRGLVEPVLGGQFFPVRGILFDKVRRRELESSMAPGRDDCPSTAGAHGV